MFRSVSAVILWYVWLLFAGFNLIDLGLHGRDKTAAVLATLVVLVTGVLYVAALRPRIVADGAGVTLRNPLRDVHVPWGAVTRVDVLDAVRIHCGDKAEGGRAFRSWAVQTTGRAQARARMRARREQSSASGRSAGRRGLLASLVPDQPRRSPNVPQEVLERTYAQHVVSQLAERAQEAHRAGVRAGEPHVRWSWLAFAALVVPAIAVGAVVLAG